MDLNELDNSQMILLTLFVSFVTAIASGIVTVTLMEEAPQVVTQTVKQVVTKTVEKVVPGDTETKVITTEKTVVIKESDLIAAAVQKNVASTVAIYKMVEKTIAENIDDAPLAKAPEPETQTAAPTTALLAQQATTTPTEESTDAQTEIVPVFVARGVILSSDGYIATDGNAMDEGIEYTVSISGVAEPLALTLMGISDGVAIAKVDATGLTSAKTATQPVKLGQSVVALMGGVSIRVSNSIISNVSNDGDIIGTNIEGYITAGAPLIDLEGDVIGLSTTKSKVHGDNAFVFIDSVLRALNEVKTQQEEGI